MPEPQSPEPPSPESQSPEPGSSAERTRQLLDSLGTRPRTPSDARDPAIPVAATVVVARDGTRGPEVLMIERPDRGSFAGAWVFPGGKIEEQDGVAAGPDDEEDVARRAGVRETWEETGLVLETDALETLSVWDPPPGIPMRIRTWFFVAAAVSHELVLAADEAAAADWLRPADVLERHALGGLILYPPTWVTLHSLAEQRSVEALLGSVRLGGLDRFEAVAHRTPNGTVMLYPGDAQYDDEVFDPAGAASAPQHRLEIGALPWVYTRTG